MTKSQINKLGKAIRAELRETKVPSINLLESLQNHRTSYKDDVSAVFEILSNIAKSAGSDSITSFRIKRIESILSKIRRQPSMALGNMGDIAGCRILVYREETLPKLIKTLHSTFQVKTSMTI